MNAPWHGIGVGARWGAAIVLTLGAILTLGVARQRSLPLERPLAEVVPSEIQGFSARDVLISGPEAQVAGFDDYLFRVYEKPEAANASLADSLPDAQPAHITQAPETPEPADSSPPWFSLYVGYYQSQAQGNTIHSPKNCLPGAGWEALSSEPQAVDLGGRIVTVNRYLLENEGERALVLYWYQGRGRIAYDEYRVKIDLLMDAALRRRSDEALVRIVVPVTESGPDAATDVAMRAARIVAPSLYRALPPG